MQYNPLQKSLELPCGATLKNRLAKPAMSDSLGDGTGDPTEAQIRLYERWAEGGVALSIIGEVQGDARYPEKPGNLVLGDASNQDLLQGLASRGQLNGSHLWPQIGHAGALSHPAISRPVGPSALSIDGLECGEMSVDEVQQLPAMFARAAARAQAAGFAGVQLHAAHGFLLSQFLSPLFNRRSDGYGGSIEARGRIVVQVIDAVRRAVGAGFPVGIKINSSDQLEGGFSAADALELVRMLDRTSIDLIDISGGTYFPGAKSSSDGEGKGPYFIDFARQARGCCGIPLMLTGGFKTRQQALQAIESAAVDVVGVARALVIDPDLPSKWLAGESQSPLFPRFESAPVGGITAWYTMRLTALAEYRELEYSMDLATAIRLYEERDAQRCKMWKKRFGVI